MTLPQSVIVTGTPCTGKTTLAKRLARKWGYQYIDGNALVKKQKLYDAYDRKRKCYVVNLPKFRRKLEEKIREARNAGKGIIIDSHLSHELSPKLVDLCIVTTCDLKVLSRRLRRRRYSKAKIEENLECEIMGICEQEAREKGHRVIVRDTSRA